MKKLFILVALIGVVALMSFNLKTQEKIERVDPLVIRICDEEAAAARIRWGWTEEEEVNWYWECIFANL